MNTYTPTLNLAAIKRKQKGITKEFGGLSIPYYKLDTEGLEGQVVRIDTRSADTVILIADGEAHLAFGFLLQNVIDDSTYGQLQGYHFANDTRSRPGQPVGILGGAGYAKLLNYSGAVGKGAQAYLDPSTGKLVAAVTEGNGLPVIFDEDANSTVNNDLYDTTSYQRPVRVRFNFNLAIGATIGS